MENLLRRHPRRQILQDIVHSDAATLNARFSGPDAWIDLDPIHQILHVPSIVVSEPGGQFTPSRTNERARRFLLVANHHRDGNTQAPNRRSAAHFLRIGSDAIKHRDLRLVGSPQIGLSPSPADSFPPSLRSPLSRNGRVAHGKEVKVVGWSHIFDGAGDRHLSLGRYDWFKLVICHGLPLE